MQVTVLLLNSSLDYKEQCNILRFKNKGFFLFLFLFFFSLFEALSCKHSWMQLLYALIWKHVMSTSVLVGIKGTASCWIKHVFPSETSTLWSCAIFTLLRNKLRNKTIAISYHFSISIQQTLCITLKSGFHYSGLLFLFNCFHFSWGH